MYSQILFALWASIPVTLAQAITIAQTGLDDDPGNFDAAFAMQFLYLPPGSGNPLEVNNATLQAPANSSGVFSQGPWGMQSGAILTTGAVSGASYIPGASSNQCTDNQGRGNPFCGVNSYDAAVLTMNVTLAANYSGITSTLVYASK